jgi:hypothetical protein
MLIFPPRLPVFMVLFVARKPPRTFAFVDAFFAAIDVEPNCFRHFGAKKISAMYKQ